MDPRIAELPPLTLAGVAFNPESEGWDKVPTLWWQLAWVLPQVQTAGRPHVTYGYLYRREGDEAGIDTYLAGVEVATAEGLPQAVLTTTIPGGTYAVFTIEGGLGAIGAAYRQINEEWMPNSGWREARCGAVEVYDERFAPTRDCCFEIRVAVTRA